MSDVVTKLTNLVNPQVMGDIINGKLDKLIKVMPYAKLDNTLEGQAGDTITVPVFAFIGEAVDVAEGEDIPTRQLNCQGVPHKVKKCGIGGILTDEAVLSGYGNPVGELSNQMAKSIASKCDQDSIDALYGASTSYTSSKIMSYEAVVDAIDVFNEEENSEKVIFIHPKQVTQLRKDSNFISKEKYNNEVIATGEIGMVANAHVVPSKRVKLIEVEKGESTDEGAIKITSGNIAEYQAKCDETLAIDDYVVALDNPYYKNPIVKLGVVGDDDEASAITIFLKRDTNIETERKSKNRTTEVTGDKMYVVALTNDEKVVILKALKVASV